MGVRSRDSHVAVRFDIRASCHHGKNRGDGNGFLRSRRAECHGDGQKHLADGGTHDRHGGGRRVSV